MTKYRVTNGSIITEFLSSVAASSFAEANGGTVSSFDESPPPSAPTPTSDQIARQLDTQIFPFIKFLINGFAAQNIALGITQYNKSGDVLALFEKKYPTASMGGSLSLKACFDTGSLYEAIKILQYVRDNTGEYSGLSPFVTDARLLKMKNDIEAFLGLSITIS